MFTKGHKHSAETIAKIKESNKISYKNRHKTSDINNIDPALIEELVYRVIERIEVPTETTSDNSIVETLKAENEALKAKIAELESREVPSDETVSFLEAHLKVINTENRELKTRLSNIKKYYNVSDSEEAQIAVELSEEPKEEPKPVVKEAPKPTEENDELDVELDKCHTQQERMEVIKNYNNPEEEPKIETAGLSMRERLRMGW